MTFSNQLDVAANTGTTLLWRRISSCLTVLSLLFVTLTLPMSALSATTLESIAFSSLPGEQIEIRMQFDNPPPEPTGYTIEQPARIALDLSDVSSELTSKHYSLGSGNARSVTVIESGGRTRVIVSMTELVGYSTRREGNQMIVLVGDAQQPTSQFVMPTKGLSNQIESKSSAAQNATSVIENIDFRRGELGEGRIIVSLSDPSVGIDITQQGGKIRVEFANTGLPISLQRRLDVTDFATPVHIVDALAESDKTVLVIEPSGEFDYLAYQADNLFTLEVKTLSESDQLSPQDAGFKYRGEKLSLNFQDVEIRSVLQLIADFTDQNLVTSDTVAGRITLRLKNVPWDQALDIIMKIKGLDKRQDGNVLMIAPADELAAREKLELESRQQISQLAPLRTEFIEVKYAKAAEVFALFEGGGEGSGVLSGRGSVIVDERTNSIILTETSDKISEFRAVLKKLDVPVRQVLIEARIVTATSNFSQALGVRWGGLGFGDVDGQFGTAGGSLTTSQEIRNTINDPNGVVFGSPDHLVVDLGVTGPGATSFAIGLVNGNYLLDLEISALESEGSAEVIARPKVITADKQEASISSGVQIPYQEASSSGATSTSFVSATLELSVKPQITPDNRILMELEVKQDTVGTVFNGVPSINTNNVKTQVLVDNGETIVLGGIFTTQETYTVTKTPFFGDLPFVGVLFRRKSSTDDKQELLIFITPTLIQDSLGNR